MTRRGMLLIAFAALVSTSAALDPPPFGTILQQWNLPMSDSGAGAGITWRRDSGLLYLVDQTPGRGGIYKLDPADPTGTIRRDTWVFANFGTPAPDIPWGIAWDPDSGCFWMSQAVDGDMYAGCYLVRMAWSDGAWRWRGAAADSWGRFDSTACWGMAKRQERGYFIGARSAALSGDGLYEFDPYTKTVLGLLGPALAGCKNVALVPADSYYVITNDTAIVELDSAGRMIQRVSGGGVPADMELVIPVRPRREDTVFLYGIRSNPTNTLLKVSAGLLWGQLSYGMSGVSCIGIVAPVGTIDSGQAVAPTFVARVLDSGGASGVSAGYRIDFSGGGFAEDSVTGLTLPGMAIETLAFSGLVPPGRDSMSSTFWVRCPDDSFHQDDTIRNRFFVRVTDIAVPWVRADKDTFEPGEEVTVQARVENRSNVTLMFDVNTRLGDSTSTRNLNLAAGGSTVINCGVQQMPPGIYFAEARAIVPGDLVPGNNSAGDTLVIRGQIQHDFAALRILEPAGTADTITPVTPRARVGNVGTDDALANVFFRIAGPDSSVVMSDSLWVMLGPGDSSIVVYPEIRFTELGRHVSACSVYTAGDQNCLNDMVVDTFEVEPIGVAEMPGTPTSYGLSPMPNPVSRRVTLEYALPPGPAAVRLYDIGGRAVLTRGLDSRSKRTTLDLRHLSAGVYVMRLSAGTFSRSGKLVLQH